MTSRDPETRRLVRESLSLVVQSERVLQQLQDHVGLLRTFVDIEKKNHDQDDQDDQEARDDRA